MLYQSKMDHRNAYARHISAAARAKRRRATEQMARREAVIDSLPYFAEDARLGLSSAREGLV